MARTFIALLCILAPLTDLKIGNIQPAELLMFVVLPVMAAAMLLSGFSIKGSVELIDILRKYGLLLTAILVLAIFAMRLPMYPPTIHLPLLKMPPILSIARIFQFIICIGAMVMLVSCFARRPNLIRFFVRAYVASGLVSAAFALVSWAALYAGLDLGGAYGDPPRARAFFVEGGPFGVYLVSVVMVVLFGRLVLRNRSLLIVRVQLAILFLALVASSSKAGILLVLLLLIYFQVISKKGVRVALIAFISVALIVMSGTLSKLESYVADIAHLSSAAAARSDDPSLVLGRVMASILIPRMIADHPLAGIGLGNYSLQRDNPDYLRGLPTTDNWDLPGLGLLGYVVELGIPLFLILVWLLWRPVRFVRRRRVSSFVVLVASYQLFAHLLGVQITFVYPWTITALALGFALNQPLLVMDKRRCAAAQDQA